MAAKKKSQATRGGGGEPKPAWVWLLAGMLLGLALSGFALYKNWVPHLREPDAPRPDAAAKPSAASAEPAVAEAAPPVKPKYDFYTVLPEMEVAIPDEKVAADAAQQPTPPPSDGSRYFLQTGSFRSTDDAEQMKARLALLGLRAQVVSVDINGEQWHRVRVGPYLNARELDDGRRTLQSNGLESIALKEAAP